MFNPAFIQQLRKQTPGIDNNIHFNNAGAALMPEQILNAMINHLNLEAQIGGYEAAAKKNSELEEFRQVLANLLNAHAKNMAYAGSATEAYNRALSSIPFKEGEVLLTTQDDYVSNQIAFLQIQKRNKIKLVVAPVDEQSGGVDLEAMKKLIDRHQPKLVAVTHIPTNSGLIQDVETIGQFCKQKDTWYLVDACQSAGQLPLDVEKICCDFLSATFRKFLRGPRGAGFLYVSDKALDQGLEPVYLDLHSAQWSGNLQYTPVDSAKRFEQWERPHALILGAKAAVRLALEIGLEPIKDRVQHLSNQLRDGLGPMSRLRVLDKGPALGGIVTFYVPGVNPQELKQQLQEKKINCSLIAYDNARYDFDRKEVDWAMRVSPHYYNTEEEVSNFLEVVSDE